MAPENDLALLSTMIEDMKASDPLYQPSNYWQVYFDRLVPSLYQDGLQTFRASGNPVFRSMGVSGVPFFLVKDLEPYWFRDDDLVKRSLYRLSKVVGIFDPLVSRHARYLSQTLLAFQNAYFQLALQTDPNKEILQVADSGEGEPRDLFIPEGYPLHAHTISFIKYFLEYYWAKRLVDFKAIESVFEIGGGYGGQE